MALINKTLTTMRLLKFILVLCVFASYAQEKDTLIFHSNKKYTQEYVDSLIAIRLNEQKIDVYKKILESDKSLLGWPRYYAGKGNFVFNREEYDSGIYYLDKAIDTFHNSRVKRPIDEKSIMQAYIIKGLHYTRNDQYERSIKNYQKALDLAKVHNYIWKGYITAGIGDNHLYIGNDSLALHYFNITAKDTNFMSLPRPAANMHNRIGLLNLKLKKYNLAEQQFKNAIKIAKEKGYPDGMYEFYLHLGYLYYDQLDLEQTEEYIRKALEAYNEVGYSEGNSSHTIFLNNASGFLDIRKGDLDKGITSLKKTLAVYDTINKYTSYDLRFVNFAHSEIQNGYARKGDYKNALKYKNLQNDFYEKYNRAKTNEELQRFEVEYQTKEKDLSIAQLEESKKEQDTIIKQQRYLTFGVIGLLLLGVFSGVMFWRSRKLKNQFEKENLEQRLLRSQMNPHFISNALNVICGLVDSKSENAIPYVNRLASMFRLILNNSREDFISLEEETQTLTNFLELQSNFSQKFDYEITVQEQLQDEDLIIPPMLIQPFVENAIIHGISNIEEKGKIVINISKENNMLRCLIEDNGIGYSEVVNLKQKNHKSVSGNIVKERLEILKRKFKVNTHYSIIKGENKGTQVDMYLPYLVG